MKLQKKNLKTLNVKKYLSIFLIIFLQSLPAQKSINTIDVSTVQIRILKKYRNSDSIQRNRIYADSIYTPYQKLWNGYLGNSAKVVQWLNDNHSQTDKWIEKSKDLNGKQITRSLQKFSKGMKALTGYDAKGDWYILFGPAWTDLGGLGRYAMVIDLSHENNKSTESIEQILPHEITHQIMMETNQHNDKTALEPIIGEGFAVWVNQKYWNKKYTLAQHLGYTDSELKLCEKNIELIKSFFEKNKFSEDNNIIDVFRSRETKLNKKLPGAIGYYIGYKIIEQYVLKNGKDSWKDIFTKSPREVYEKSGF